MMENVTQPTPTSEILEQNQPIKNENNNQKQTIFILSSIVVLLLLIVLGGLYYFYISHNNEMKLTQTQPVTPQHNTNFNQFQSKIILDTSLSQANPVDFSYSLFDTTNQQQQALMTNDLPYSPYTSLFTQISPNHKYFAIFSVATTGGGRLNAYSLSDGSIVKLATPRNSNQYDQSFAWSPDSTKIVFVSTDATNNLQLYIANVNGTGLQQLTNDNDTVKLNPIWSPDGKSIIYGSTSSSSSYIKEYNLDSKTVSDITPTNPQTKKILLTGAKFNNTHTTVGWIDNDHLVTFYTPQDSYSVTNDSGIWLISLSTGQAKQIAALSVNFGSQGILSEDKKIISTAVYDDNTKKVTYYLVHTDGSGTESYTVGNSTYAYAYSMLSQDNTHLAYQTSSAFWVHDFTTNQTTKIMDLTGESSIFVGAVWSPDSTQLALKATIIGGAGGMSTSSQTEKDNQGFWLSNIDGTNLRKIDSTSTPLYWY